MAFDGIVISALTAELRDKLIGGRIVKISQPEKEELVLTIKNYDQYKLFLSVGAGMPLIYLTEQNKPSPMTAPNFCMLLRKYLNSAKIIGIEQPDFERTIRFQIEHLNELGDRCVKYLIIEIMGKHSNIIFCDESMKVVDSIRHVSGMVSSVREVLPGRDYFIPKTEEKRNPMEMDESEISGFVLQHPLPVAKAIVQSMTGFSPLMANELCCRAGVDADRPVSEEARLTAAFRNLREEIKNESFQPQIIYPLSSQEKIEAPLEFSVFPLVCYRGYPVKTFSSVSEMLEKYYAAKNTASNARQHSMELRKTVGNFLDRALRKLELQKKQLQDTAGRDKYKVYGELLTTYGYSAEPGAKQITVTNYYDNQELTIPLDPELTAIENAKHYFERYSKQKRTAETLEKLIPETGEEVHYLESVRNALDIAVTEGEMAEIREELSRGGYVKKKSRDKKGNNKGAKKTKLGAPLHFRSSDGYDIYVGKNNLQNEELTFQLADGNDWWFHAKGIPGSHVIVKSRGEELPDRVFEEAGALAAYFSSAKGQEKAEVDYTLKKNVKKPGGGRPGFVVYYTNYSLMADGRKIPVPEHT